ncbi:glycosyltransferase family 4 protein [Methyloferula stellata]|uniref:glycosyltransferase family 4 protein n=1 Tax=Methyloferula stellata TaxID=876270 RepID=UPI0003A5BF86|nr:glycosyltransferase family 1 protein [Methyloferula stellata]
MERIHESDVRAGTSSSVEPNRTFTSYQIEFLLNEIAFLQAELRSRRVYPAIDFLHLHMMQLYWTVTRVLKHIASPFLQSTRSTCGVPLPRPSPNRQRVEWSGEPRLFIDVTSTHRHDAKTGIQRVVREVAKASIKSGWALPVIIEDGQLRSYFRHPDLPDNIEIKSGDRLLLLDTSWNHANEYPPILDEVVRRKGVIIGFYYDIIPLLYPGLFVPEASKAFQNWFEMSLPYFSAVATISRSVALDVSQYISSRKLSHKSNLRVGWFHLGADFDSNAESTPSEHVVALGGRGSFFLLVGTLEPRKNHVTVLAAFEQIWKLGGDACCVIVGKRGWLVNALCDRIQRHPEFGRKLFWFETCSDADLTYLYHHATALIQASLAEGFGLPLVEAAHFGTPVIASDIPVFREIGGSSCSYFDPVNAETLAGRVLEALKSPRSAPTIAVLSWADATERLLKLIKEADYEFTVPDVPPS